MPICVRPWKPPLNETIPGRPVKARATFTAFSTASAPVETSMVLAGPGDWRNRVQPLGEAHVGLVRRDLEADVAERLQLLLDGGNDLRMLMTGVDHGDAGAEVDIALAVLAPDLGVLGALGIDRGRMADAARHGRHSALMKLGRIWHVDGSVPVR